ncbi:MAG: hypothetical protein A2107_12875 [Verrucomicrobia bacterium GWF2_62_7]|nr:MAG: hypothetical protein A2107_12875 [Verrucomicrobia bacterium GWF2_62_7]
MNIGIDIDGVLADSVPSFLTLLNLMFGKQWTPADITTYRFEDALGIGEKDAAQFWKLFARQGGWSRIKPIRGAVDFCTRLAKQHAIILVTGRPRHYVEIETKAWLRQHKISYDELIFVDSGQDKLQAALGAGQRLDLFIEDSYEYGKPLADAGIPVLLIDYPWNRDIAAHQFIRRIKSLAEVPKIIAELEARARLQVKKP